MVGPNRFGNIRVEKRRRLQVDASCYNNMLFDDKASGTGQSEYIMRRRAAAVNGEDVKR